MGTGKANCELLQELSVLYWTFSPTVRQAAYNSYIASQYIYWNTILNPSPRKKKRKLGNKMKFLVTYPCNNSEATSGLPRSMVKALLPSLDLTEAHKQLKSDRYLTNT